MFETPGSKVKTVHIEEDTVIGKHPPRYEYHAKDEDSSNEQEEGSKDTETPEDDSTAGGSEDVAFEQSTAAKAKI